MDQEYEARLREVVEQMMQMFTQDHDLILWEGGIVRVAPVGAPPEYITVEIEGIYDGNVMWRGVPATLNVGDEVLVWEDPNSKRREIMGVSGPGGAILLQIHDHSTNALGGPDVNPETFSERCYIVGPGCPNTTLGAAVTAVNAAGPPASGTEYAIYVYARTTEVGAITIPAFCNVKGIGENAIINMAGNTLTMSDDASLADVVVLHSGGTAIDCVNADCILRNVRVVVNNANSIAVDVTGDSNAKLYRVRIESGGAGPLIGFNVSNTATPLFWDCDAEDAVNIGTGLNLVGGTTCVATTFYCRFAGSGNDVSIGAGATWNHLGCQVDAGNTTIAGTASGEIQTEVYTDALRFEDATILTIGVGGDVTRTQTYHVIAAGAGVADDLDNILGGAQGDTIIIRPDTGDTITVRHNQGGAGDIWLQSGASIILDNQDHLHLIHDGTSWCDQSPTGAALGPGVADLPAFWDTATTIDAKQGYNLMRFDDMNPLMILPFAGPGWLGPPQLNTDGYLWGHRGQNPINADGGVIFRAGTFNKCVQTAEACTNLVLNPVAGAAGNFAAEGAATVSRDPQNAWNSEEVYMDVRAYRVQTAADNQGIQWTTAALANAIHYLTLRTYPTHAGAGNLPPSWDVSIDNVNWHTMTNHWTHQGWTIWGVQLPAAQCNGSTTIRLHQNGAGSGDFMVDGIQIEQREYPTFLCYGGMGIGHTWSGAAHGSTSTRAETALQYQRSSNLVEAQGTLAFWMCPPTGDWSLLDNAAVFPAVRYIFQWEDSFSPRIVIRLHDDADIDLLYYSSGGFANTANYDLSGLSDGPHHFVFQWESTWDATPPRMYIDGVDAGIAGFALDRANEAGWLDIGHDDNAGSPQLHANMWFEDMIIFEDLLTPADVLALYNTQAPIYQEQRTIEHCQDAHANANQGQAVTDTWEDLTGAAMTLQVATPSDIMCCGSVSLENPTGVNTWSYIRFRLTDGTNVWTGDANPSEYEPVVDYIHLSVHDVLHDVPAGQYTLYLQGYTHTDCTWVRPNLVALVVPKQKEDQYRYQ